ncbi:MAG: hypothetical protein WD473_12640 [Acidimicrobiia bacterium]
MLRGSDVAVPRTPVLSFGSWDELSSTEQVIQICHPDWRGVRTVAYSFGPPVVECDNLTLWSDYLIDHITRASVEVVVIQGWPPGAGGLAARLAEVGIEIKCVLHSSPAQHGAEAGEAAVIDEVFSLGRSGILTEVGMAKVGVPEAFTAAGYPVTYVPNRVPVMPAMDRVDLGPGLHVGVFAEPFWRKNVVTQLLAVGLLDGAVAHVMRRPEVSYLDGIAVVEHGELAWERFVGLQGSVDINLYVTLSECHPSTPQESYLAGVPCLISRVSGVFEEDPRLWEITTTDRADDPSAIARAARELLAVRDEAVERARSWMAGHDRRAAEIWDRFTTRSS